MAQSMLASYRQGLFVTRSVLPQKRSAPPIRIGQVGIGLIRGKKTNILRSDRYPHEESHSSSSSQCAVINKKKRRGYLLLAANPKRKIRQKQLAIKMLLTASSALPV